MIKSMGIFEKQQRTTFKAIALKEIRKAILEKKLLPGDRIIEQEISEALGISRFPVREALSSLEKAGLLVSVPFKGTYVAEVNEKDLEELYIVRNSLEQLAVRLFIETRSVSKMKTLEAVIADMARLKENEFTALFLEDMRFHQTLCELSENGKLLDMWISLKDQLILLVATHEYYYSKPKQLVQAHSVIVESIRNHDIKSSVELVSDHIMEALEKVKLATARIASEAAK